MSDADYSAGELEARRESWAGRPCPVEGCQQRFTNADTGGRHLDQAHDERGRWAANRLNTIQNVGRNQETIIYDDQMDGRWIQSSLVVEAPQ
jgi:hypothetical protein